MNVRGMGGEEDVVLQNTCAVPIRDSSNCFFLFLFLFLTKG